MHEPPVDPPTVTQAQSVLQRAQQVHEGHQAQYAAFGLIGNEAVTIEKNNTPNPSKYDFIESLPLDRYLTSVTELSEDSSALQDE